MNEEDELQTYEAEAETELEVSVPPRSNVFETPRHVLRGAILECLKVVERDRKQELEALHVAEVTARDKWNAVRREIAWVEHGVRPGSVVEWMSGSKRSVPIMHKGEVLDSNPDQRGIPTPIVRVILANGQPGVAKMTLHHFHEWKVVTE